MRPESQSWQRALYSSGLLFALFYDVRWSIEIPWHGVEEKDTFESFVTAWRLLLNRLPTKDNLKIIWYIVKSFYKHHVSVRMDVVNLKVQIICLWVVHLVLSMRAFGCIFVGGLVYEHMTCYQFSSFPPFYSLSG